MVLNPVIKYVFLSVLVAVAAAALLVGSSLLRVGVEVNVSVPPPTAVRVNLNVTSQRGEETLPNVTRLKLEEETPIVFRVTDVIFEGNVSLALSGKAILRSVDGSRTYSITMPCMVVRGTNCFRTMNIILGWDAPITIEPGEYVLTLKLSWFDASGDGKVSFTLEAEEVGEAGSIHNTTSCAPSIEIVGTKPESAEGWIIANGSTRSFATLVSPPERLSNGCYVTYVWVWFFNGRPGSVDVKVVGPSSGETVISRNVALVDVGTYEEVLLRITLPPDTYLLKVSAGDKVFEVGLKCVT